MKGVIVVVVMIVVFVFGVKAIDNYFDRKEHIRYVLRLQNTAPIIFSCPYCDFCEVVKAWPSNCPKCNIKVEMIDAN